MARFHYETDLFSLSAKNSIVSLGSFFIVATAFKGHFLHLFSLSVPVVP